MCLLGLVRNPFRLATLTSPISEEDHPKNGRTRRDCDKVSTSSLTKCRGPRYRRRTQTGFPIRGATGAGGIGNADPSTVRPRLGHRGRSVTPICDHSPYSKLADSNDVTTFFPAPGTGFNEQTSHRFLPSRSHVDKEGACHEALYDHPPSLDRPKQAQQ